MIIRKDRARRLNAILNILKDHPNGIFVDQLYHLILKYAVFSSKYKIKNALIQLEVLNSIKIINGRFYYHKDL